MRIISGSIQSGKTSAMLKMAREHKAILNAIVL
jgi:thymidine kinase